MKASIIPQELHLSEQRTLNLVESVSRKNRLLHVATSHTRTICAARGRSVLYLRTKKR